MLPELAVLFSEHPAGVDVAAGQFSAGVSEFGRELLAGGEVSELVERRVEGLFQARVSHLQHIDRQYWGGIIRHLKYLRAVGKLMPERRKTSAIP